MAEIPRSSSGIKTGGGPPASDAKIVVVQFQGEGQAALTKLAITPKFRRKPRC
jgi:hypothetical protein